MIKANELKLAILCGAGAHHDYLIARVTSEFEVTLLVREPETLQRARLKKKGRHRDFFWANYHAVRRKVLGLDRFRRRYFDRLISGYDGVDPLKMLQARDINSTEVKKALRIASPEITLVMGTSILRRRTLRLCGKHVVNIHGGLLPYYRGNHCIFFALYDRRPDLVGATIHYVDRGVDTGDIIDTVRPDKVDGSEVPEHAYCLAVHLGVDQLLTHLSTFSQGIPFPRVPQPAKGRTIRTRDRRPLHDFLHYCRRTSVQDAEPPLTFPPY